MTGEWSAAEEDYLAALDQVAATMPPPVVAAGYSFGAATALRVGLRDARVSELILVAPPVGMVEKLSLEDFRGPIHVIAGGRDELAPLDELSSLLEGLPNANLDVIPEGGSLLRRERAGRAGGAGAQRRSPSAAASGHQRACRRRTRSATRPRDRGHVACSLRRAPTEVSHGLSRFCFCPMRRRRRLRTVRSSRIATTRRSRSTRAATGRSVSIADSSSRRSPTRAGCGAAATGCR